MGITLQNQILMSAKILSIILLLASLNLSLVRPQLNDVDPSITIPITEEEVDKFALCTKSFSTIVHPLYEAYRDAFNTNMVKAQNLVNSVAALKKFANECLGVWIPQIREKCSEQ